MTLQTNADEYSYEDTRISLESHSAQECLHVILTVHIYQDADVGASHSVENLTGNRFGEEGVICRGDKHTLSGPLQ